jgi:hypothetical protein
LGAAGAAFFADFLAMTGRLFFFRLLASRSRT